MAGRKDKVNVLFITLAYIDSIEDRGIYQDLLRKFRDEGHNVTIITPIERRAKIPTSYKVKEGISILYIRTLNIKKTNIIEKGLGTLLIEYQFLSAVKKYLKNNKFDLVLYTTPPITFSNVIEYVKRRDRAYSYLLLKDIFPQNAVDMKMLKKSSLLYRLFLKKEKKLYRVSDTIGCMSQANVNFVLNNNPEISESKVEVNPNSIHPIEIIYSSEEKKKIRIKYGLPLDKKILVYGGNLGKPQGLNFFLKVIRENKNDEAYFLIVGDGTEFSNIKKWFGIYKPQNAMLLGRLPRDEYSKMLATCDIGLIFLHRDFLIPNFPSRLLSYLEMKKPVIAATDPNTDIGDIIEKEQCGYKVLAGDIKTMNLRIDQLIGGNNLSKMGEKARGLLERDYKVDRSYKLIMEKL